MMKRIRLMTAWLLVACMLFSLMSFAAAEENAEGQFGSGIYSVDRAIEKYALIDPDVPDVPTDIPLTPRQVLFYLPERFSAENDPDGCVFDAVLYFPEDMPSVPYMEIGYAMRALFNPLGSQEDHFTESIEESSLTYTRPNGGAVAFNFETNTITIDNYSLLKDMGDHDNPLDVASYGLYDESSVLSHYSRLTLPGHTLRIDLSDYGIHMLRYEDRVYIPLQTFNDLFVSTTNWNWAWNGEALFEISPDALTETDENDQKHLTAIGALYYAPERKGTRPSDLIMFTYRELCLALDIHYGLKTEHSINTFNEYMIRSGLIIPLLSEDPAEFYLAMCELTDLHFADNHSNTNMDSPFGDPFRESEEDDEDDMMTDVLMRTQKYMFLRSEVTGNDNGPDGYTEYGDTAYITFDDFNFTNANYATCELKNDPNDTIMLILYAHQQITRKNSPIRNVVIDLTCNGGGTADAAAAVIAWYLTTGTIQIEDALTQEKSVVMYRLDANRDGMIDENDLLPDYIRKFCLTSGASFSCGNLVPAAFRASDEVILIGRKSGGGACVVQPLITADGLLFQCSGSRRISTATNGSFSSVDDGIVPDYVLTDMSMVYRRDEMTDYINSLK